MPILTRAAPGGAPSSINACMLLLRRLLQDASLATFRRDPALKAIQTEFKQDGNARLLAEQLDAYFVENGLYREVVEPTILEQIVTAQALCRNQVFRESGWIDR